jgi:hypothetical protein
MRAPPTPEQHKEQRRRWRANYIAKHGREKLRASAPNITPNPARNCVGFGPSVHSDTDSDTARFIGFFPPGGSADPEALALGGRDRSVAPSAGATSYCR